jgi:hypothetical protein
MEPITIQTITALITNLESISESLPNSIPLATHNDKIYHVLSTVNGETPWATFNRRFDILFGNDCQDENGHLHFLQRSKYGIDTVCNYLKNSSWDDCPLDLVHVKLTHVVEEIIYLVYVTILAWPFVDTNHE